MISTPRRSSRGLDGQVFLDETEDAYCVWRAEYSQRSRICSYFMDIFRLDEESGRGSVAKSCTGSGPMSPRSWWNISLRRAFRTSVSTAT